MNRAITAEDLMAGLVEYELVSEDQFIHALGAQREDISLNDFEVAVVREHLIGDDRLLQLKGTLSGYPVLDDHSIRVQSTLSADLARTTGSLLLELPRATIAMVEPTEYNIEMVASELGTHDFDIWLTTASNFGILYRAMYHHDSSAQRLAPPKDIYEAMTVTVQRSSSDLHLSIGQPPIIREDGKLVRLGYGPINSEWMTREIPKLIGAARFATLSEDFDIDTAFTFGSSRFRVNVGADFRGPTVALRKIPVTIPSLDVLGLPKAARDLCDLERGLVLVTGPTGSGKSTTIASILAAIATSSQRHLITLEDPIEYHIPSGRSVVNQRELYESFMSFPHGLRQALRQDPDVILVGELRDLETMRTALTAAETGHLVFATMHTYDAVATVSRLISSFPGEEQDHARAQIAYILKGIISQTLLPTAATAGRVAAFEIMLSTPAIQANLRKHDGHNQLRQTMEISRKEGMQTMEISLVDLVRRGLVREADAEFASQNRESFRHRLSLN